MVTPADGERATVLVKTVRAIDGGMVIFVDSSRPLDDAAMNAAVLAAIGPPAVDAKKEPA